MNPNKRVEVLASKVLGNLAYSLDKLIEINNNDYLFTNMEINTQIDFHSKVLSLDPNKYPLSAIIFSLKEIKELHSKRANMEKNEDKVEYFNKATMVLNSAIKELEDLK